MEEIKVGDYVRTKKYGIARVDDIKHCIWLDRAIAADPCVPSYCFTDEEYKNIVKKHSPNIIDLIEKDDVGIMNCYGLLVKKFITESDILELKLGNYELLKVVTKEQFAAVEYKLDN